MISHLLTNPEATATVLSILAAVIVGFFGYRQTSDRHRREYTLNVLAPLLANDRLFKTHDTVVNYRIKNLQPDYATVQANEREDILQLLGYYEFLSAAFMRGDLDRRTVLSQRKSTFRNAFETPEALHPGAAHSAQQQPRLLRLRRVRHAVLPPVLAATRVSGHDSPLIWISDHGQAPRHT